MTHKAYLSKLWYGFRLWMWMWISLCKKSKPFIDSFQRYWWSTNPAIRLEERLFWSINWNSVYHFKEKNSSFRNQYLIKTFFNLTMSPRPIKVSLSSCLFYRLHEKRLYYLIPSRDIDDQRILQSDWTAVFWPINLWTRIFQYKGFAQQNRKFFLPFKITYNK